MEIIFLGTSSGAPTKSRNVSGVVVKKTNSRSWYLIDCGEGTQHQILHTKLSLSNLEAIFITHVHGDHCFGLPGLLASATMSGRTDELTIVCPKSIQKWILDTCEMSEMRFSYDLKFHSVEDTTSIDLNYFNIDFAQLSHRVPSYAFGFTENNLKRKLNVDQLLKDNIPQGKIWGILQNEMNYEYAGKVLHFEKYLLPRKQPRKIVISGDNDQPDLLTEIVQNANVLIHEATFTEEIAEKIGSGPQHCSAKSIARFAQKMKISNLILTHFSARYEGEMLVEIEDEAKLYYQGNLFLANDFDGFVLGVSKGFVKKH